MSTEIQNYQTAIDEFTAAGQAADRISKIVGKGAHALENWTHAIVANASGGFPPELVVGRGDVRSLDAREWPSAQQIADTLQAWHAARSKMRAAYQAIPESLRGVVKPPV